METRKEFISRMVWLASEVNSSEIGSALDVISMMEYQLKQRDGLLFENIRRDVSLLMSEMNTGKHSIRYSKEKLNGLLIEKQYRL